MSERVVTAVDRVKAYGTLLGTTFLCLKLPLVAVGLLGAAGVGIASTQVEGSFPAVLGKIKDTYLDAFRVVGGDVKSLFGKVDSALDEGVATKPPIEEPSDSFLKKTSRADFEAIVNAKKPALPINDDIPEALKKKTTMDGPSGPAT